MTTPPLLTEDQIAAALPYHWEADAPKWFEECCEFARAIESATRAPLLAEIERLTAERDSAVRDAERLDFLESAYPHKSLRYKSKRWSLVGFTSYEFETHKTLRAAIDSAREATNG